jgi:hypothetical protein
MTRVRLLVALAAVLALAASIGGSSRAASSVPTGLHGFLLRADEPARTSFSRTPAFGWNPVPGAVSYEFQLSMSSSFRQSGLVYEDDGLTSPVAAPALTLPWITGSPHALYARVRATINDAGATSETDWSNPFGFDMVPPPPPKPLPSSPGVLRWVPVDGADGYEVWLIDVNGGKKEQVFTNVLDEREFYTFHQSSKWIGSVRWRIRALRNTVGSPLNGVKPVQYGAWSPIYSSSNPDMTTGPIELTGTLSDVSSLGDPASDAHRLMPAFTWTGNQASDGTSAELFRVYVYTDKQCINRVFTSAIVGSPSYAPRPHGPLSLPTGDVASARKVYIPDGAEPSSLAYDGTLVSPTEAAVPAADAGASDTGSSNSSSSSSSAGSSGPTGPSSTPAIDGAPIDLWDVNWPEGGYYWTVIPVAATQPGALLTNVAPPGSPATATLVPVTNGEGFAAGDTVTIGNTTNSETATVTSADDKSLTLASALKFNHGPGEPISRTGGSLRYQDLEMPQDVCADGRVARFGKESEPSLTASGDLFASGLSNTGRLTSARHTAAFYKAPLVSWTPALGADQYEIQWSKSLKPFDPKTGGDHKLYSTSFVLPITTGTWYYRVRGFDRSQPGSQGMSWSDPAMITVTVPTFTIVASGKTSTKPAAPKKTTAPVKKAAPASAYKRWSFGALSFELPTSWKKEPPTSALFSAYDPGSTPRSGIVVVLGAGRNGRTFDEWAKTLVADAQSKGAVGAVKTSIVTLPAGKAVWLSFYRASANGPLNTSQYVIDGGNYSYDVVMVAPQSKESKYLTALRHAATTFKR